MDEEVKELDFGGFSARPEVLEAIAGAAAGSVEGVAGLVGASGARGAPGRRSMTRGVSVSTAGDRLEVTLHLAAAFGTPLRQLGERVKEAVAESLYNMTGWPVARVDVFVGDVRFEERD